MSRKRPEGWTEEDEQAMLDQFTFRGSCGCDGALDDGCPNCTEERLLEWWSARQTVRAANSNSCEKKEGMR